MTTTYTHPDVFTIGVRDGWADPETDPTRIDWTARQAAALIPFKVVNGRPVNPCEPTDVDHGRNELGHWAEQPTADAKVTLTDQYGRRWIALIERKDGLGWALPGGYVDPGESALDGAIRELREETRLVLPGAEWHVAPPRYVPDPRASREAWMVTVLASAHLPGLFYCGFFPGLFADDDARRADWIRADDYDDLVQYLAETHDGHVFAAHRDMLRDALG